MLRALVVLPIAFAITSCADDAAKPAEEDVPVDGKLDTIRTPTYHGDITYGATDVGKITADEGFHAWTFELSAPSSIHAFTSRVPHEASIDTVMYLYQLGPTGWGAYIERNDDDGRNHWSSIDRDLPAGRYRVLVKGYLRAIRGKFQISVDCDGAGCAPAPGGCLFGDSYNDIRDNPNLVPSYSKVTSPTELSDLDKSRVILAVQQSSHTDVTTVEEAFAAVDQNEFNVVRIYEPAGARTFTAIEYGVGDNSYGAIFYWDTTDLVSSIHDGDLEGCSVQPEVCLLGSSWSELRNSTAYTTTSERVVTMASELTGVAAEQALSAIRVGYEDATDLADGLTRIDGGELNVITRQHTSGQLVDVFEYGAGDNSYGAVFHGGTTMIAAEINDLDFYGCNLFE